MDAAVTGPAGLPQLTSAMSFEAASAAVIAYLRETVALGSWAVSRYDGRHQVFLSVHDEVYGMQVGDTFLWSDSMCQHAVTGKAPRIAPDAMAVPLYAGAGGAASFDVGAFVSYPIRVADGALFGSLCGFDPSTGSSDLLRHQPLMDLLSGLLGLVLQADLDRAEHARQMERAAAMAESDPLTGLVNRRGWERFIAVEEQRYRRFGDPGSVVIVDLDGLKQVNDHHGHAAGDRYIRRAASALVDHVRHSDLVARLGGDEFGVLAARTPLDEAEALVARLRAGLAASGVPASVGHAPYTFVAGFPGAWEAADAAMYADKRLRRLAGQPVGGSSA